MLTSSIDTKYCRLIVDKMVLYVMGIYQAFLVSKKNTYRFYSSWDTAQSGHLSQNIGKGLEGH